MLTIHSWLYIIHTHTHAHKATGDGGKHFSNERLPRRKSEIHSQLQHLGLSVLEIKESASTKGHETQVETDFHHSVGEQTHIPYQTALEKRLDTSIHHSRETKFAVADNQIN